MFLSIVSIAAMAAMSVYMFAHARGGEARRLAWLPAASAVLELLAFGMLSITHFPLLTLLLTGLRLSLLGLCTVAMRRDALAARARQRRREQLARELRAALNPLHEIPAGADMSRRASAPRIHVA